MSLQTSNCPTPVRSIRAATTLMLALSAAALAPPSFAAAADEGRWLLRGGVSHIAPNSDNGRLSVGDVNVDSATGPSLNIGYRFTPNWTVDVLAALPFEHDFAINGASAGSTQHLPPTVTVQYHFLPEARVQPFIGVGLNYTLFMDEQLDSGNELKLSPSFGPAAQIGFDVPIDKRWRVGFDARYIDIDTKASVDGAPIGTINIDPIVYSLNLGYRF